ncbi:outer membrane lipoprotein carrier protein LolA [Streptomyces piniterrae]|uniref:Outer membrane lipoprotein carrier protein LolA n=1 Tax=Streptomyces piniterrae TaxID=2571125 RepID=A0A4U0NP94_9ACTN|nr:outer membrane lipoprotein carrier protein LolA [Streptomyces piniterrae]TJZ51934.1 outer membrane lipoprotein carrier protein LolA [Streptomyces piniterrae]
MPRNEPTEGTDEWGGERSPKRRKAVRYGVPVAVVGVTAATIGLVPAFAGVGSPDLPKISAQDLVAKIATSDVQQLSGTVRISTDLGLPGLPGGVGAGAFGGDGPSGGAQGEDGASASPQNKLMELASGAHTLRVAADGPDKQRVSIVDKAAEYSFIHNGAEVWAYDSGSNTAVHSKAADGAKRGSHHGPHQGRPEGLPKDLKNATPQDLAKEALKAAGDTTSVTVDGTARVAGRDAYQLVIKPKQSGSTIGAIRISVDAENGVPLKFTLTPKSGGAAAIDAGFTNVDFAKPDADTFSFTPPKGAKVVDGDKEGAKAQKDFEAGKGFKGHKGMKDFKQGPDGFNVIGKGWTSIATIKGSGQGLPSGKEQDAAGDAGKFLDSVGDKVTGSFGSGRVFSTRLVNALVTDDGTIYAGAVDKQSLIAAANAAK